MSGNEVSRLKQRQRPVGAARESERACFTWNVTGVCLWFDPSAGPVEANLPSIDDSRFTKS